MTDLSSPQIALTLRTSSETAEMFAALVKAQATLQNPPRNRTVRVKPREKDPYEFSYATLDKIVETVRAPLAENGLGFLQFVTSDQQGHLVVTRVFHISGQWIESDMPVFISSNGAQAFGSGVSYAKRYSLTAMLGIVSEGDDDANIAEGNSVRVRDRRVPRRTSDPIADAAVTARTTDAHLLVNGETRSQYAVDKEKKQAAKVNGNGLAAAGEWVTNAIAAISTMKYREHISDWWRQNEKALTKLRQDYSDEYERLCVAADERRDSVPSVTQAG